MLVCVCARARETKKTEKETRIRNITQQVDFDIFETTENERGTNQATPTIIIVIMKSNVKMPSNESYSFGKVRVCNA